MRHARPEQTLYGRPGGASSIDADVGLDDVADVGDVAARIEVADADFGRREAGLDAGDLPREARDRERRRLARTGMVERPRDHDVQAVVLRGRVQRELILRELRQAVRAGRHERRVFVDRIVAGLVDLRRRHDQHAARRAAAPHRVEQMVRAERVVVQVRHDVLPRRVDLRRAGQVIDDVGLRLSDRATTASRSSDVDGAATSTCRVGVGRPCRRDGARRSRGARSDQPIEQVAAGESRRARDERRRASRHAGQARRRRTARRGRRGTPDRRP